MQRIVFTQENILLMQALTPLFQGRKPVDIFTQFCRAKLQRTVNPLCLSYPLLPSAARWFPPLIPLYFNFLFFMLESKKDGSHPKTSHYGEAFVAHKKMV